MRLYFVGSTRGKKFFIENYRRIVQVTKNLGYQVSDNTLDFNFDHADLTNEEKVKYYRKVLKDITKADVLVAEASYASMGVGYEISLALEKGKAVLVMYLSEHEPGYLSGVESEKLVLLEYSMETLENDLKFGLEQATSEMDVRFNFFVSPKIVNYLDWISKKKKMPRAVYLRRLIEKDMSKDEEFIGGK